jgi:hypothetical protein
MDTTATTTVLNKPVRFISVSPDVRLDALDTSGRKFASGADKSTMKPASPQNTVNE